MWGRGVESEHSRNGATLVCGLVAVIVHHYTGVYGDPLYISWQARNETLGPCLITMVLAQFLDVTRTLSFLALATVEDCL